MRKIMQKTQKEGKNKKKHLTRYIYIGIDLAGLLGGGTHGDRRRWVRAEWSGVYGEGCPFSSQLKGLRERRELPSGVRAKNGFWRILKATERSFLNLYDKIRGGGTICISVPRLQILGHLSPLIYAHVHIYSSSQSFVHLT